MSPRHTSLCRLVVLGRRFLEHLQRMSIGHELNVHWRMEGVLSSISEVSPFLNLQ